MRIRLLSLAVCVVVTAQAGPGAAQVPGASARAAITVSVPPFVAARPTKDTAWIGPALAEMVASDLAGLRRFAVVQRDALDQILAEQSFSVSDLASPEKTVEVGRMIGVYRAG